MSETIQDLLAAYLRDFLVVVVVFCFIKLRIQHVIFVFISRALNTNSTIYFLAMMN